MTWIAVVVAAAAAVIYIGAWKVYHGRQRRHIESLKTELMSEQWRRTVANQRIANTYGDVKERLYREERDTRYEWDRQHEGVLSEFEIDRYARSMWPFPAAFQQALILAGSLFLATVLLSNFNSRKSDNADDTAQIRAFEQRQDARFDAVKERLRVLGDNVDTRIRNSESTLQTQIAKIHSNANSSKPQQPWAIAGVLAGMFAVGFIVFLTAKSSTAQVAGAVTVMTASLLAGLKLLSVEKVFESKNLLSVQYSPYVGSPSESPGGTPARAWVPIAVHLPPFDSGAAEPDKPLREAIESLATELASDKGVISVTIVGRADRRELLPCLQSRFGTNWALAQRRADSVRQIFEKASIQGEEIIAVAAGPVLTEGLNGDIESQLEDDRSVTVYVSRDVTATAKPWLDTAKNNGGEWPLPNDFDEKKAPPAPDPCAPLSRS